MTSSHPITLAGIDLGGTFVHAGIVDAERACLLRFNQAPIEAAQGAEQGIARIIEIVEKTLGESQREHLDGIGIGSTGPVDPLRGTINNPYTLPGWEDVDILAPLQQHFGVPVRLENDADAAALGEYWTGAGQNVSRLYAITVGTGIGTAFILNGQIYRGLGGTHPDGGHQIIDPAGPPCYCGANGCWESLSSGTAIARLAQAGITQHPHSRLLELVQGDTGKIDARLVAKAAELGDPFASALIEKVARDFSLGLVNVITLFVPDVIVLGGGVMKSSHLFMPFIEEAIAGHDVMVPARQVRVLPARLGNQAGTLGAAYAILQKLQQ